MKQFKLLLKEKAIITILATLIPVLVALILVYNKNNAYLKHRILDTINIIAESYEGQVYQFMEMAKRRTEDFASDGLIKTQLQRIIRGNVSAISRLNEYLVRNKLVLDKTINTINILSTEGRVVASTNNVEIGKDLSRENIYLKGKETVTMVEKCFGHCELTEIAISAPILSRDTRRLIGVIVNYIPIAELNNIVTGKYSHELGAISWDKGKETWKTFEIYLVNRDKRMITKPLLIKDAIWKQVVDTLPINEGLTSNKEITGFYRGYRGVEVVGASMYIPSMKWVLLIEIDKSEVLSPVRYMLAVTLITAGVVVVIVSLFFVRFIRTVVNPLQKISTVAKKIASGNFEVVLPVKTQDEMGVLCESFNYMAQRIKANTTVLMESESRLNEAQRIAQIGNWAWDVIKNEVSLSYEAHRIFGINQGEGVISFETFLNYIHPEDRGFVKESFDKAINQKKPLNINHRVVHKNATVYIINEKAVVVYNNGNIVKMIGTVQDITERKLTEETVLERSRLSALGADVSFALIHKNTLREVLQLCAEALVRDLNAAFARIWTLNKQEHVLELQCSAGIHTHIDGPHSRVPVGMYKIGLIAEERKPHMTNNVIGDPRIHNQEWAKQAGMVAFAGYPLIIEDRLVGVMALFSRKPLTEFTLKALAYVSDVIALGIERKQVEEQFQKLYSAVEQSPMSVVITDIKGNIQYVNPTFSQLTGYSLEEAVGKNPRILKSGETPPEHYKQLWDTITKGGEWHGELCNMKKNGEFYWESASISSIKDYAGKITHFVGFKENITEKRHLKETQTRLSEIAEGTTDFVGTATIDGRVVYINRSGKKLLGIGEEEDISNSKISDYHPKWAADLIQKEGIPTAMRKGSWIGESAFRTRDGHEIPISQVIMVHKNSDGTVKNLSTIGRDVTERKRFETQIMYMANRDPLTNLLNRRRFNEELEGWIAQARRFGTKMVLLFLDLDNFKYVNDSYGHQIGDKLLVTIANICRARVRTTDVLARLGGDEFAIILTHADVSVAESVANQIREAVQHHTDAVEKYPEGVTVSIGIAVFPEHGDKAETLLTCADLAMYNAKEEGRNCVRVYTPKQKTHIELRLVWERRIREALDSEGFALVLQPIMDIRKNLIMGHEVLLRLINEKGEMELPGVFLPIAERFGLIHDIDRWVVKKAIHLIKKLKQDGKPAYLEVNISGKSFADKKLLPMIRNELAVTGVDTASLILVFEITETALIENMADAQSFISELKSIGCLFALDDFGIGFSSFNYLKQLPVDYLKIDGSFIVNLARDTTDQHLVKAMVEVARGLGKKTTAEFVGSEETLCLLREYGIDYAQGYHIGKPLHISEI